MRRIVVTGLGCVSALGLGVTEFSQGLRAGRSAIARVDSLDTDGIKNAVGAQVNCYTAEQHFEPDRLLLLDRFAQFAILAAREAVSNAALSDKLRNNVAVILGSGTGGKCSDDAASKRLYRDDGRVHPFTIARVMSSAATSQVTIDLGITGPAFTVSSACASATHAIAQAALMIRGGVVPIALAGGSDAVFCAGLYKAWQSMRVLAPDTCRPFDRNRRGLVLGEGAAILVLEDLEHALARDATIHAEFVGFGMTADAEHITTPSVEGISRAMTLALEDSGLASNEIGYINAHGTGTVINDATETAAIKKVFGQHARRLLVSSTKSMHGHALGASGALECVATILALEHGFVPPTANYNTPDPECDLDYVPNEARIAPIDAALSNSFAFGGLNAVVALRRWGG